MKTESWFQKDVPLKPRLKALVRPTGAPLHPAVKPGLAARLRPHELIAMLTHHYTRVRARSLPRVTTRINVSMPGGKQAVVISFG